MTPREVCAADACARVVAIDLPPIPVVVQDPAGVHRMFRTAHSGLRVGANRLSTTVFSVIVRVAGRDYCVPPDWMIVAGCVSNVVAFRGRGA